MSLNDLLEIDLRTLAGEAKRKTGDLKEVTEKTINLLRQSEKIPVENLFLVLNSAKNTNNPKICTLALSILQKLLTGQALENLTPSLQFMKSMLEDTSDENLHVKVLQTLMLLLDPRTIKIYPELTTVVWNMSISLQSSKAGLIRNTASATLRQLVSIAFHEMAEQRTPDLISSSMILVKNTCELARSRQNELFKLKPEAFGLLLEILDTSKAYVSGIPELFELYNSEIANLIVTTLYEDIDEHTGLKCIKCGYIICEITTGNAEILKIIIKLAENRKIPEWLNIASLEFLSQIMSNPSILKFIFADNSIHSKLLDSLSKVSHELFAQPDDLKQLGIKNKVRLISEIISHWVDSIAIISEEFGIKLGELTQDKVQSLPESLVTTIWKPLLPILSIMVSNSHDETILQTMLNSYQTLVNLSGTLNLSSAREALLASLCQFCIPSTTSTLSHKHMHICKTLFNITHCLGFVLDSKAWHKVLDTLYKLDYLLHNSTKLDDPDLSSDITILTSAMESLFRNTHMWPDSTIVDLMSALGQLTLEFMETLATNDKKITGGKVFGIEKMIIVGQNNLDRIELYWDSLSAYLDCICNSKYPEIRSLGTSSVSRIVLSAFKKFIESPPKNSIEKWQNWQRTLLLVLHDLLGSAYSDTQESVFNVLYSILQTSGGQIDTGGWSMLLFILCKLPLSIGGKEGFKCLQLIVSDFLQSENLLPSLERLITSVSKYAHSEESTQAIGAVGMYWNIADYLGKIGKEQVDLWWIILEELKVLGEDPRFEVRHSALHSLHIALSTHGSLLSPTAWQRVMQDIVLNLLDRISANYFKNAQNDKANKSLEGSEIAKSSQRPYSQSLFSDSSQKQWEETYNIFTQNLGKIFRTYLNNLEKRDQEVLEEPQVKKNWDILVQKLKEGINFGTMYVITAVLKTMKELLSCVLVSNLFFSKWSSSWELMVSLRLRFETTVGSIPFKLISIILEVLELIYQSSEGCQYEETCLRVSFGILSLLLKATANEKELSQAKLLPEQREIWEFIEKMLGHLEKNSKGFSVYTTFLLKYLKYDAEEPHADAFCRKALEVSEAFIRSHTVRSPSMVNDLLSAYEKITFLRFANETYLQALNTSKGALPLWYICEDSFIVLLPGLCTDTYWEKVLSICSGTLNPSEKLICKLTKQNLEAMAKAAEELDIKFAWALAGILKETRIENSQVLQKLVGVIDNGCDSFYKAIHAQELILQKSFMSACFNALLSLSQENSFCAQVSGPVLVGRCKEILLKFGKEEKLSGQMPLPRVKLLEMLDFLNSLRILDISATALAKPGKKGHLMEIFPQLCELITVKDSEIKEALKQVFLEISRNM